ncbi:hypothetical protein PFISCL1PPCAC_25481, partial [Pristionchus fissidentatus]
PGIPHPMNISKWLLLLCSIVIPIGNCRIVDGVIEQEDTAPLVQDFLDGDLKRSSYGGNANQHFGNTTLTSFDDELKSAETDFEWKRKAVDDAEKLVES